MTRRFAPLALSASSALLLSACSLLPRVGPDYQQPPLPTPSAWQAPLPAARHDPATLPHQGQLDNMRDWWQQLHDPLLVELIESAERESAGLADAGAKIAQARADAVAAGVAGLPQVDAGLSAKRSTFSMGGPVIHQSTRQLSLLSSWEIDLFGGLGRQQEGAQASLAASQARWHDARVSLAAETANAYLQLRLQENRITQAAGDSAASASIARLSRILGEAGFQAPPQVDLSNAGAAEAAGKLAEMRAERDVQIKALVALTGIEEARLREKLSAGYARFPEPAPLQVAALPAATLQQRPDLAAAERDLAAASAAIGHAKAAAYPRLTLSGSVTPMRLSTDGAPLRATTWSIGPSLTVPLFDGGRIDANVDAASAAYQAAAANYRQKARDAVREVEQALVRLDASHQREAEIAQAAASYRRIFKASEARQSVGLASQIDVEDSRRAMLAADLNVAAWQQERLAAWIALYRAAGGGWQTAAPHLANTDNSNASRPGNIQ